MMATRLDQIRAALHRPTDILPLVIFRMTFGVMMLYSTVRFIRKGWIAELYINPQFHFTYWGFSFIKPLPANGMYIVFGLLIGLCIMIILGAGYRLAIVAFFLLFTYVELLDKAYYLNHYYFVSVLSFLLIFLPLNQKWAVDSWLRPNLRQQTVPHWTILIIQIQLGLVYFLAGVAKLNHDWLYEAVPLRIWLRAHPDFPILGRYFLTDWFPYVMSWGGAIYDLTIVGWLLWGRTRWLAYLTVLAFHIMTDLLFHIGVFPWVMIACTLIFFTTDNYRAILRLFNAEHWLKSPSEQTEKPSQPIRRWVMPFFTIFFITQFLVPFRHHFYEGNTLWTQEAFRFSWRVMLVESSGYSVFYVRDPETDREWRVYPSDYLTIFQENQMSFQPDMLLEFAHFIEETYQTQQGYGDLEVRVEAYVRFNGRSSRLLIDPTIDLTAHDRSLKHQDWILQYDD